MTQAAAAEAPPPPVEEKSKVDEKIVKLEALEKEGRHITALIKDRDEKREISATDRSTANESQREADKADEEVDEALAQLYRITRDQDIPPLFRKGPAIPEDGAAIPEDGAWRFVTLACLAEPAIKPGILSKLATADIKTMGGLCDFQQKYGDMWNRDIKGVGKAALDNIAEATTAFWQRWAATTQATPPGTTSDAPPAPGGQGEVKEAPPKACGKCGAEVSPLVEAKDPKDATTTMYLCLKCLPEPPAPAGGLEPTS
jgi:hypothetical protein